MSRSEFVPVVAAAADATTPYDVVTGGDVEVGLFLDGLRCASCVVRVEKALGAAEGVSEARVSFTTHRAQVRIDPAVSSAERLVDLVKSLGYAATSYDVGRFERPAQD